MNNRHNALENSASRLLASQQRSRSRLPESHLQKSFQTPPQFLKLPSREIRVEDERTEFYTRTRALRDLVKGSHTTVEESIEKVESYGFPKDDDPTLDAACEALSDALRNANEAMVKYDTAEVKQALDNLRKVYDDAAKSNTVMVHYIDVVPPFSPDSPYSPLRDHSFKPILLARSWMKELISGLHDQSLHSRLVVTGNPGSGKSVALVGYLLFYLIARGARVILQSETLNGNLGYVFDDDGIREVSWDDASSYDDGRPCYLLVNADFSGIYPSPALDFCDRIIVVTPPNIESRPDLKSWKEQASAELFIVPPFSRLEVVYLLSKIEKYDSYLVYWMYREWTRDFRCCESDCRDAISHLKNGTLSKWYMMKTRNIMFLAKASQERDEILSDLFTMERRRGRTRQYDIMFATARIAEIVADVREKSWPSNWETLNMFLRNPETHVAARRQFRKMFLRKFQGQDPNTIPPCYELGETTYMHPLSPFGKNAEAAMPWKGLGQKPTLFYTSDREAADGILISKKELRAMIDAVMDKDSPPICFLIPCARNWQSWDAAYFLLSEKEEKREVHIVFLQMTIRPDHEIYAKGLDQVRDAIPKNGKRGKRLSFHYHYVLVLLTDDEPVSQIPEWRHVLLDSNEQKKDTSWRRDNLREYIMFVPMKELLMPQSKDFYTWIKV